jgi:hypothetical protein
MKVRRLHRDTPTPLPATGWPKIVISLPLAIAARSVGSGLSAHVELALQRHLCARLGRGRRGELHHTESAEIRIRLAGRNKGVGPGLLAVGYRLRRQRGRQSQQ